MYVTVALYTQKIVCDTDTVDGKQSFSPVMYEFRASQVVQDFVHQPYENTHKHQTCVIDSQAHETNTYTLWTVPWLMATREVLDTVKSIQVAFWSFANHLCGLQPSQICRKNDRALMWAQCDVGTQATPWNQGRLGSLWNLWNQTKLRDQISNIPHSGKSRKSMLFIFIMIMYTLVWSCLPLAVPACTKQLDIVYNSWITMLEPKTWSTIAVAIPPQFCVTRKPIASLCASSETIWSKLASN